jgi:hypothetical protein
MGLGTGVKKLAFVCATVNLTFACTQATRFFKAPSNDRGTDIETTLRSSQSDNHTSNLEFKVAGLAPVPDATAKAFGGATFYLEEDSLFSPEDIQTVTLRKEFSNNIPPGLLSELKRLPPNLLEHTKESPFYSVRMGLSSLGRKIFEDVVQKNRGKFLFVLKEGDVWLITPTSNAPDLDHPVFYMGQKSNGGEAQAIFRKLRSELFNL